MLDPSGSVTERVTERVSEYIGAMTVPGTNRRWLWMVLAASVAVGACSPLPTPSASPAPSVTPAPTASPPSATPTPTVTPTLSPTPVAETVTCIPESQPLPAGLEGDPCPDVVAAVRSVVEPLGTPTAIYVANRGFDCGDVWPGVGSPVACFGPLELPGTRMHGWVTFAGTDNVAAVSISRRPGAGPTATPSPWVAKLMTFEVPPAGWAMP